MLPCVEKTFLLQAPEGGQIGAPHGTSTAALLSKAKVHTRSVGQAVLASLLLKQTSSSCPHYPQTSIPLLPETLPYQ